MDILNNLNSKTLLQCVIYNKWKNCLIISILFVFDQFSKPVYVFIHNLIIRITCLIESL